MSLQPTPLIQRRLARQHPWKSLQGPCFSAAVNHSLASLDLLAAHKLQLGNVSVGALRLSVHGLEEQALHLLQATLTAEPELCWLFS